MKPFHTLLLFFVLTLISCAEENGKKSPSSIVKSPITVDIEQKGSKISEGDSVLISVSLKDSSQGLLADVYINDSLLFSERTFPFSWYLQTEGFRLGRNQIKVSTSKEGKIISKSNSIILMSSKAPVRMGYKVVNEYPHDKNAYTQGLLFENGFLYEGTGHKGQSSLRKVELETGKVIEQIKLDGNIFGEGITLVDDKVYQLSWSSGVGFVYDFNSFEEKSKFYYSGEGWGICYDGQLLIKSDGTQKLTFHEKEQFNQVDQLEVYSDKTAYANLNELEWIDGKIYANVWQKDEIVIINPKSGEVESVINLKGLLKPKDRDQQTDVLNGIAHDKEKNRLFVTGKYWSKLFEIELVPES